MAAPPPRSPRVSTRAVHAGEPRRYAHDALTAPIVQTSTYSFRDTAELVAYMEGRAEREEYGRYGNPSVRLVEEKLSSLEGTEESAMFSSGMAAVTTSILALTRAGSHVILFNDCYRRTRQFVTRFLDRFGVSHSLIPPADLQALSGAITEDTRLVVSEAPTNPYQTVVDIDEMAKVCRERGVKTMIDATFATPVNLRPAEHGVDLVIQSATKYLSGHNDVLAGLVSGPRGMVSLIKELRDVLGAICDPHAAYLVQRGLKTLVVRVQHQNDAALRVAKFLEGHAGVAKVWYPGLPSHPNHPTAKRLMGGFGGVVTFEVSGDLKRTSRFIDACTIAKIAPSLGGVESLIEQPALMSYFELSTEQRESVGISDNLVRLSVGLEDVDDLLDDLQQALMA